MINFFSSSKKYFLIGAVAVAVILVVLLVWVLPGDWVLPQAWQIGTFTFRYYGLILMLAVGSAYLLAARLSTVYLINKNQVENIALVVIIFGFLGARAYHVLTDFELYRDNLVNILAVWNGGLSIFGALAGGLIGLAVYKIFAGWEISYWRLLDWLAPAMMLGQIIGRFGNLFNYEAYGVPTQLPWKMFVPIQFREAPYTTAQYFHPLFLYEALAGLLLLVALLYLTSQKSKFKAGTIFATWLLGYGMIRLTTELLRADLHTIFGIKVNLIAAGAMVAGAIIIFLGRRYFRSAWSVDNFNDQQSSQNN